MRVLAVTNMYPTTEDPAYGVFVHTQIESLRQAGVEVDVDVIDGRRSDTAYLAAIRRIGGLTRGPSYDVVHAHYGLSGFCAAFQRLPLIVSFCGDDLLGTPNGVGGKTLKSRAHQGLSQLAAMRADAIICKSQELVDALWRATERSRAVVIPNGVDVARFGPGDRIAARRRLGIHPNATIALFPHTAAVPRKRFRLAQAAVKMAVDRGASVELRVVSGVSHEQMPDYYRAADCLLLTSDQEGSPNTVKEALCCDLPVVSTDVGDVREWVNSVPGCEIVSRDPNAIAVAIMRAIKMGRVDGATVRSRINRIAIATRVIEQYHSAMRNRGLTSG